jgi:hypothetical protein
MSDDAGEEDHEMEQNIFPMSKAAEAVPRRHRGRVMDMFELFEVKYASDSSVEDNVVEQTGCVVIEDSTAQSIPRQNRVIAMDMAELFEDQNASDSEGNISDTGNMTDDAGEEENEMEQNIFLMSKAAEAVPRRHRGRVMDMFELFEDKYASDSSVEDVVEQTGCVVIEDSIAQSIPRQNRVIAMDMAELFEDKYASDSEGNISDHDSGEDEVVDQDDSMSIEDNDPSDMPDNMSDGLSVVEQASVASPSRGLSVVYDVVEAPIGADTFLEAFPARYDEDFGDNVSSASDDNQSDNYHQDSGEDEDEEDLIFDMEDVDLSVDSQSEEEASHDDHLFAEQDEAWDLDGAIVFPFPIATGDGDSLLSKVTASFDVDSIYLMGDRVSVVLKAMGRGTCQFHSCINRISATNRSRIAADYRGNDDLMPNRIGNLRRMKVISLKNFPNVSMCNVMKDNVSYTLSIFLLQARAISACSNYIKHEYLLTMITALNIAVDGEFAYAADDAYGRSISREDVHRQAWRSLSYFELQDGSVSWKKKLHNVHKPLSAECGAMFFHRYERALELIAMDPGSLCVATNQEDVDNFWRKRQGAWNESDPCVPLVKLKENAAFLLKKSVVLIYGI